MFTVLSTYCKSFKKLNEHIHLIIKKYVLIDLHAQTNMLQFSTVLVQILCFLLFLNDLGLFYVTNEIE